MRRHRLNNFEVAPVKQAIENQLRSLAEKRDPDTLLTAEILFRVHYRLETHIPHRPNYPNPTTWATIRAYINGTVNSRALRTVPLSMPEEEVLK